MASNGKYCPVVSKNYNSMKFGTPSRPTERIRLQSQDIVTQPEGRNHSGTIL